MKVDPFVCGAVGTAFALVDLYRARYEAKRPGVSIVMLVLAVGVLGVSTYRLF